MVPPSVPHERGQVLAALQRALKPTRRPAQATVSSGCRGLDALLPGGGFPRGAVIEWLGPAGGAAGTLALLAARQAAAPGGALVVLDRLRRFYPPAAVAWGIDPRQLIVLHPRHQRDALWALEQVLRCRGVAAAWAPLAGLDGRSFRRLQLAAETSGCLGLLLRPPEARGDPSWAELQLVVRPAGRSAGVGWRWWVELTRGPGEARGRVLELELDPELGEVREVPHRERLHHPAGPSDAGDRCPSAASALPVAAPLAPAAAGRRQARA